MSTIQKYPYNPIEWPASPHDSTGDNQLGIYVDDPSQSYIPGTRHITWDGRVFKYSKSYSAALLSGFGAGNASNICNISVTGATVAAGDRSSVLAFGAADGVAGDGVLADKELVGGYWITGHGASTVQTRLIIDTDGVSASGVGANITLHFDHPVSNALTTPFTEVVLNPYRYLIKGNVGGYSSTMGVPAANRTATYWGWLQTWGPCWINPGSDAGTLGDTGEERVVYFVGDGAVNGAVALSGGVAGYQIAGFMIDSTVGATDALPLVMLQLSI